MTIQIININGENIAEINASDIIIRNVEDAVQLMVDCSYGHQAYKAMIYQENITPDFFELKTKLAGEILQKYTQYGFDIAIIGSFSVYNSKSLNDFIYESNKGKKVNFVASKEEALRRWRK